MSLNISNKEAYYNNVSLLLSGNGPNGSTNIIDSSPSPKTVSVFGNAQISTAQSRFGGSSIAFDGNGDYLSLSGQSDFAFGLLNFTIEAWIFLNAINKNQQIINFANNSAGQPRIEFLVDSNNKLLFFTVASTRITSNLSLSANVWYHVALCREGTNTRLFINGNQEGNTYIDTNNYNVPASRPVIGILGFDMASQYFDGYIDDLRITKGVARYTSNFTPPVAPFSANNSISFRKDYRSAFSDPDVQAYISAVETADGQALEYPVAVAIDEFVRGCKSDGIWDAIKASCILAGARTLNGALVPLKGTAPTRFGFVAGDYNRKTGLVGDGSTKYLNSNRNNNADPQNSKHLAVYSTQSGSTTSSFRWYMGDNGYSVIGLVDNNRHYGRINDQNVSAPGSATAEVGMIGVNRSIASSITLRLGGSSYSVTTASEAPSSTNHFVFRRNAAVISGYSNARLAFYSIGEALDLALLDARVTTLMNAFTNNIP